LPQGWVYSRLNNLGDWGAGATPNRSRHEYYGGNIPWFKSGELNGDYISISEEFVTDLALKETSLRYDKIGDVLIAMYGATIGKTSILEIPATTNQAVCACTPFPGIFNVFLLTLLKAYKSRFIGMGAGGAQPNISREKLIATVIPLPPLAEQHRIVAKVDELMALCDELETQQTSSNVAHETLVATLLGSLTDTENSNPFEESWQRIANHFDTLFTTEYSIDQLKQTILQLAVMGKLTQAFRERHPELVSGSNSASELLKKIAKEKVHLVKEGKIKKQAPLPEITEDEKPFELPGGWKWVRIGDASLFTEYGLSEMTFDGIDGVPVLKMGDIQDGKVILGGHKMVPKNVEGLPALLLKSGDLLYNRTNSAELVGKTGIFEGEDYRYTFASYLIRIRCSEKSGFSKFLNLSMNEPSFRKTQIEPHLKQQCGQANVNGTILKNMIVPLPPLAEQHRIVSKVDELFAFCDELKERLVEAQTLQNQLAVAVGAAICNR